MAADDAAYGGVAENDCRGSGEVVNANYFIACIVVVDGVRSISVSIGTRTYQTRLCLDAKSNLLLSQYSVLFGKAARTMFAAYQAGKDRNELKRSFLPRFKINSRHCSSVECQVKQAIEADKASREFRMKQLQRRLKRTEQTLKKLFPGTNKYHQKKRLAASLSSQLEKLRTDDKLRICFGSRKLYRDDKAAWKAKRSSQFYCVGSKDESAGNLNCQSAVEQDGSILIQLRLPDALGEKYLVLSGIRFSYGHEEIVRALWHHAKKDGQERPITYRFLKDRTSWRVCVTLDVEPVTEQRLGPLFGRIGVDINADHLAIAETDRYGNPVDYFTIPLPLYGKSAGHRKTIIGSAVRQVVGIAFEKHKPIVVEKLDFTKKKESLRDSGNKRHARVLSSLAYSFVIADLKARAHDVGVTVEEVNPAYSSVIGRHKFSTVYRIDGHHAAALVLARRSQRFSERLPRQLQVTLPESAKKEGRHVWSLWAFVKKSERRMHRTVDRVKPILSGRHRYMALRSRYYSAVYSESYNANRRHTVSADVMPTLGSI